MAISINTLRGGARLVFDSVAGITNSVERMHATIARPLLLAQPRSDGRGPTPGPISAAVYAGIRGTNGAIGAGVDRLFGLLPAGEAGSAYSPEEVRITAALNGVFGDHLEATGNPLALPMSLYSEQSALEIDSAALRRALPEAGPHLTIFLHGLCLSELSWRGNGGGSLGSRLQAAGETALYLRYNTGRHISSNGQDFNRLLDKLVEAWPVPLASISLIGHSMGGLVIRSAAWYADQSGSRWLDKLRRVVCLGTPHHGSPLEKAGHALDVAMHAIPYVAPLAYGRHRSAGIKDLHYGDLLDEDWQGSAPDRLRKDKRRPVPLLPGVDYYFVAATVGRRRDDPLGQVLGDLLVRLDSAVGSHRNDRKHLPVSPENCRVFHERHHFDLLTDERVHQQILDWFRGGRT